MSKLNLDGRVAIVTGASRGLGRAIAQKLSSSGCRVVVGYRADAASAEQVVAGLPGGPGSGVAVGGDLREPQAVQGLIDAALDRFGQLDIFVHNAAMFRPMPALGADLDTVHQELRLALDPLLNCAPLLAKVMNGNGSRVIAVSSNGAGGVIPAYLAVGLAKAALENLVRYLAVELAGRGIAVNAISTALLDKDEKSGPSSTEIGQRLAARTPAGRLSRPADVADAVALLCADEAAWICGQVMVADGGLGLWA
jgi:enoyl-[acyl-carrier protein] reductase III